MSSYTIKDIARMAGVSIGTVSRVINRADNVDTALQARIMDVVNSTDYLKGGKTRGKPGRAPGRAASGRSRNVCVMAPDLSSSWSSTELWTTYLRGIEKVCRERGIGVEMLFGSPERPVREVADAITRCGGLLMKTTTVLPEILALLPSDLPVVGFGSQVPRFHYPQIALDNRRVGNELVEYLLAKGHRRIAFVGWSAGNRMSVLRGEGYREAMTLAGLYRPECHMALSETPSPALTALEERPPDMDETLKRLLALVPRPTAVIFANDWTAIGFYKACQSAGVEIPGVFSVCGVDNIGTLVTVLTPSLTSYALPFMGVSEFAAATLLDLMAGMGTHQVNKAYTQFLAGSIVERESVRALDA